MRVKYLPILCGLILLPFLLTQSEPTKVVFMGDSITEFWTDLVPMFPRWTAINKGEGGDTTVEALGRFQRDVIDQHPNFVILLIGSNDLGVNHAIPDATTKANIQAMISQSQAAGIVPVLCSVLPTGPNLYTNRSPASIVALNDWLRATALADGLVYVDYWRSFGDTATLLRDGLHPSEAGYGAMSKILTRAMSHPMPRQPA